MALNSSSEVALLAAVLAHPERLEGQRVGLMLTGGNTNLDTLPW
jgi:hypothetical protein